MGGYRIPRNLENGQIITFGLSENIRNYMLIGYYTTDSGDKFDIQDATCYGIVPSTIPHSITILSDTIYDIMYGTVADKSYQFRRVTSNGTECSFNVFSTRNPDANVDSNNNIVVVGIGKISV